ncbi:MAG TPA: DUF6191 domain-containing protein [Actinomycetes bacterium]|nr:DUF6191 domain-containing protein [Actinomycetes bacterium]
MEVVLAVGVVLAGLLIIDRLFAAEQRRRGRKDPDGSDALSAAIMDFDGFLNPGRRHQIDEKRRQEMMRVEVAPSDPRFTQIDLDSGTAVIRLPNDPNQPTAEDPPAGTEPTTTQPPAGTEPPGTADPTDGVDRAVDLPRTDGRPGEGSG